MGKQRLSKVLAAAGVASRRACEELIFKGVVKVNGQIVKVPQTMVDLEKINGRPRSTSVAKQKCTIFSINLPAIFVPRGPATKPNWY